MTTTTTGRSVAYAILRAAWGDTTGTAIWNSWTDAERDHAAALVAPLIEPLRRCIDQLNERLTA